MVYTAEKTIAIYGGAFDPPTVAHVEVIRAVFDAKLADEIWVMPTCKHMYGKCMAPFRDRLAMCDIIATHFGKKVRTSDVEEQLAKYNADYQGSTFELLLHLLANAPEHNYSIIIGLDNALDFHHWKYNDAITALASFIVVPRPGYQHNPSAWYMTEKDESGKPVHHYLDTYQTSPISSTEIRTAFRRWGNREAEAPYLLRNMVDPKVLEYITIHGFYPAP